jgi:hypothetical protein
VIAAGVVYGARMSILTPLFIVLQLLAHRAPDLAAGARAELSSLGAAAAREQADAAIAAEVAPASAELLLAIAYRESRYDPSAGPMCGVLQADARDRREWYGRPAGCAELRADGAAAQYSAGVRALERWLRLCRRMRRARGVGLVRCALNGYAEGTAAARRGWGVRGCPGRSRCDRAAAPLARARRIGAAWRRRWIAGADDV